MTSVKRMDSASTTPATQDVLSERSSSPLPRRTPGKSGHRPLPKPPARPLTATMPARLRDIDWNGHVPTAPHGPVSLTRAQVQQQLADASNDDWTGKPVIPGIPSPRRSPEQKPAPVPRQRSAYSDVVLRYGEHAAHACF